MNEIVKIETISEVHEFFGLEKPLHPLVTVLPRTDYIANFDYGDISYTLNLYQISLKGGTSGSLVYGRNTYDFQEGTLVLTQPNQVLKVLESEEKKDVSGWTLLFHPDLIRKSNLGKVIDQYSFFSYEVYEALHLAQEERDTLTDLIEKIQKEYSQRIDKHSQELIIANIDLMLKYCVRFYDRQFYTRTNVNQDNIAKFERLLKSYYQSDKPQEFGMLTVKQCGLELNMSSHYLSDLLKKETGRSAQEHIYAYMISRAKTLLLSSSESISQIAYTLGFEYSQHFSKLFKSKTGMSPGQYRTLN